MGEAANLYPPAKLIEAMTLDQLLQQSLQGDSVQRVVGLLFAHRCSLARRLLPPNEGIGTVRVDL